ncbi:MAG: DNA methyltransferase [bacterium]
MEQQLNLAMKDYEYEKSNCLGASSHLNKNINIPKSEEVIDINFDKLEEEISKITPTNKGLMYDWHLYWSKKPHNVTDLVLKSFLPDKGTLLDPFMGYGTTILEALRQNKGIHPIGVEINELPVKILDTILRKSDLTRLQTFLLQVKSELKDELEKYYSVLCSECRDSGTLLKIEYDYKDGVNIPKILQYHCHSCEKTYTRDISNEEVNIQMAINEGLKILPDESMKLLPNSRIAVKNGMYISDIFPNRAFYFMKRVKEIISNFEDCPEKEDLIAVLSSCIHLAKFTDRKSQSQFPYWMPTNQRVERNIWYLFQDRFNKLIRMKTHNNINTNSVVILNKPFQKISNDEIPPDSIDFVMTDPPYMDIVAYSEYLKLWEYFTGYKAVLEDEIVVSNREQGKDFKRYFEDIHKSFQLIHDVLKPNKYACVWFNDTKLENWCNFLDACTNAGFDFIKQIPVNRNKYTYKQINSPKSTIKGECLLIFRKRKKSITKEKKTWDSEIEIRTLVKKILSAKGGEASTSEIVNSGLIEGLYKRGELHKLSTKYKDLPGCLEDVCIYNKDKNTWALKPKSNLKFKDKNLEFYLDDSLSLLDEFGENEFDACITDPPYNISGYDHKKEIGWLKSNGYWAEQKKFTKISEDWDKFSNKDYVNFTRDWIQKITRVVKENGNIIIFGSMHNIFTIGGILNELEIKIVNSIIWYKRNAFPNITHRMFCESAEYIIWAVNNNPKKAKNWAFNYNTMKELNNGKQMRNMWDIPLTPSRERKHGKHPAQKPLEVVKRLILGCTNPQDNIVDPFMGIGSIPLVADIYERGCTGIEKNEEYMEIAIERIKDKEYYKKCIGY